MNGLWYAELDKLSHAGTFPGRIFSVVMLVGALGACYYAAAEGNANGAVMAAIMGTIAAGGAGRESVKRDLREILKRIRDAAETNPI